MKVGHAGLVQQGYNCYTKSELKNISNGLRFTPLVCMFLALYGLYIQSPYLHFVIAAMGILPFWFPNHHPLDIFYNKVFRHIVGGQALPSNPLPRRIACLMGGMMNIGIGLAFLYSNITLAYIFGAILITLQLVVITTHFCVASWMYEMAMRMFGKWDDFISVANAKQLMKDGVLLVDVRNPAEYENGHLEGAINIPLDNLENDARLNNNQAILYCKSGMRSSDGKNRLAKKGITEIYNFGGMNRWVE